MQCALPSRLLPTARQLGRQELPEPSRSWMKARHHSWQELLTTPLHAQPVSHWRWPRAAAEVTEQVMASWAAALLR